MLSKVLGGGVRMAFYGRFANEDYGRNSCYHLVVTSIGLILDPCTSFAHIVRRMGKLESLDVKLFCATAMDFYRTLVRHVIFESCYFFLECGGCLKYCILSFLSSLSVVILNQSFFLRNLLLICAVYSTLSSYLC